MSSKTVISTSAYIIGGVIGGIKVFAYFLVAFLALAAASGVFAGRPFFTSVIFSSVSGGYTASFVSGFIPALCIRRSHVRGGILSLFAISVIVMPSMLLLSANLPHSKVFEQSDTMYSLSKSTKKSLKKVWFLFKHYLFYV
jgi:hypothetical protein